MLETNDTCQLLNRLFEAITSGIVLVDVETRLIVSINPAAVIIFGAIKDNIVGKSCCQFICRSENAECQLLDLGIDIDNQECIIERGDKTELVVLKTVTSFIFDKKKYLLINLIDITDCKQSEVLACENEQRFKDIINSTADWVWEVNVGGVYIYCSEKVKDVLGYEVSEVVGKTPFDFMELEEAERVKKIYFDIVKNKNNIIDLENWNVGKDGKLVCLLTNGLPVFDIGGNFKGYRGIDKDITKQKLIWDKLEKTLIDNIDLIKNGSKDGSNSKESMQNLYKSLNLLELEANKIRVV